MLLSSAPADVHGLALPAENHDSRTLVAAGAGREQTDEIAGLEAHEGAAVDADRRDDEASDCVARHGYVLPQREHLGVGERRLEVQRPFSARRPEEHGLGGAVELDHARAPRAREAALHRRRQRRAAEEERVDRQRGRIDALRLRDLAEDDRLERQAGEHVGARPAREIERARERHVPVDVAGGNGDSPALLRDELHDVRRRRHERVAVEDDTSRREHVGMGLADRARIAQEVGRREPRGVAGTRGPGRLAVMAHLLER